MFQLLLVFIFTASAYSNLEQCLQNERGVKLTLKLTLNGLSDPDSQRLEDLKMPDFCQCYMGVTQKQSPRKSSSEIEAKTVECVKKAGFGPPSKKPEYPKLSKDSFFEEKISFCGSNGIGRTIIIESELGSIKDPRRDKVRSMNLPQYCRCYYEQLRHRAGDDSAKLIANFDTHKAKSELILSLNNINQSATEHCVGEQIPYPNSKNSAAPTTTAFDKIINSQFTIGKGLGDIVLGLETQKLMQLMGPTGVKTTRADFDEYRYGRNLTELIIRTSPPGPQGKVIYIKVDSTFPGTISHGLKKGEIFESVIEKMKPWTPHSQDRHIGFLLYKEGVQFGFSDYNSGTLRSLILFEPSTHPLLKKSSK